MFDAPLRLPGRQAIALTSFACLSQQAISRVWSLETGSQSVDSQLGVQGNTYRHIMTYIGVPHVIIMLTPCQ